MSPRVEQAATAFRRRPRSGLIAGYRKKEPKRSERATFRHEMLERPENKTKKLSKIITLCFWLMFDATRNWRIKGWSKANFQFAFEGSRGGRTSRPNKINEYGSSRRERIPLLSCVIRMRKEESQASQSEIYNLKLYRRGECLPFHRILQFIIFLEA